MSYKISDSVVICNRPMPTDVIPWEPGMDDTCGRLGTVVSRDWTYSSPIYAVKTTNIYGKQETWWYQENWISYPIKHYSERDCTIEEFRNAGLEELQRQQDSLNKKRDEILKKIFSSDD